MSRPEHQGPPELYYNQNEARKYTDNSRIIGIQTEMAERALELLALPDGHIPKFILDLGCGSALSGQVLSDAGHLWAGVDVSEDMLEVAAESTDDDLFLQDFGQGVGFRPGTFDGAISISALQWLCHANASHENGKQRLQRLFSSLFAALVRGARAVFQFYPENESQIDLILNMAMKCGFGGGLVVDFPNSTKAKKYYLCLMTVSSGALPSGLTEDGSDGQMRVAQRRRPPGRGKSKRKVRDKGWILRKKELYRRRGREDVPEDSKYTARKRKARF